jgi:imidazolonepropionase-like amidohydrolase
MTAHSFQSFFSLMFLFVGCGGFGLGMVLAGSPEHHAPRALLVKAGRLLDVAGGKILDDQAILIEGDRVKEVGPAAVIERSAAGSEVIDLTDSTVLPGLIDCHTHVLLQGTIGPVYDEQLLKDSIPFRAIRGSVSARTGLMNGFTAMRDLSSGGTMYADVDVKRAINLGYIEGPRMFVSTRALAPTGMFPLVGYSWELRVPEGIQVVDGVDGIRKAVREQVKYGADWIKYFSDLSPSVKDGVVHSRPNFTDEEARAIVEETHRLGHKVAAHAYGHEGIESALKAGADSIEHGFGLDERLMDMMIARGVYWCPTLFIIDYITKSIPAAAAVVWKTIVDLEARAFSTAVKKGVRITLGSDAGGFPWTENEAKEFDYMVRFGMPPMQAIQSATIRAAELLDATADIGTIQPGRYADLIAVRGNPLDNIKLLEQVSFVMKGGRVIKRK